MPIQTTQLLLDHVTIDRVSEIPGRHCTKSQQTVASCRGYLESTTDVLISEARRTAEEGGRVTEECFGQCSYLKTSASRLAETAVEQCGAVMDGVVSFAEDQLSMIRTRKASAENMLQVGVSLLDLGLPSIS